ncbi:putative hydrolase [Hypnocyclicus thermotrophus]|uniref:Hydrolase n=1 Tax=Hypnocyclicus thermotrophus TaxID=1627895 RepID=A0AA46DWS5_9FUSO|nr:PHP domain-containing protein [Hypnocyclicus thermotrophus]TDT66970.1 putative hydrolase [Hypnocyclicus thermotrophus]
MKYLIDLHVHSNVSTHAYSTLNELIQTAKDKKLLGFALTNHGSMAPDSPHDYHFGNLKIFDKYINGIRLFKGIEANIISENGDTDLPKKYYDLIEIKLCGFHKGTPYGDGKNIEKNTIALINAIKNKELTIISHLGNPSYKVHYEEVIKIASEYNVAIEFNNSSLTTSRLGSEKNCYEIAELCKKYNTFISLGSDAHHSSFLGNFQEVYKIINKVNLNTKMIINTSINKVEEFINLHK